MTLTIDLQPVTPDGPGRRAPRRFRRRLLAVGPAAAVALTAYVGVQTFAGSGTDTRPPSYPLDTSLGAVFGVRITTPPSPVDTSLGAIFGVRITTPPSPVDTSLVAIFGVRLPENDAG